MIETETKPNTDSRKSNTVIYIILALMTGVAGYFGFQTYQGHQQKTQLLARAAQDSLRIVDLDTKYTETLATLNSYKGLNAQLDSIIQVREGELGKCRNEFLTMVRKNKISDEEYQKQLADLRNINSERSIQRVAGLPPDNGVCAILYHAARSHSDFRPVFARV